jgi:hypothetical protein
MLEIILSGFFLVGVLMAGLFVISLSLMALGLHDGESIHENDPFMAFVMLVDQLFGDW